MIRLIWTLSAHARHYLRRYMPTNRLLDAIRRRRNLRWGIPAMLLAAPYLLFASICTNALADGGPGWLHLVVLWSVWNAMKFIIMGPVSLILLIRARTRKPSPHTASLLVRRSSRFRGLCPPTVTVASRGTASDPRAVASLGSTLARGVADVSPCSRVTR